MNCVFVEINLSFIIFRFGSGLTEAGAEAMERMYFLGDRKKRAHRITREARTGNF